VLHEVASPRWRAPALTIAILADLHVAWPWTPLAAVGELVARTNALRPDLVLLPGDFTADARLRPGARVPPPGAVAAALAPLRAPLGVHAVLGNHDWAHDPRAQATGHRETAIAAALSGVGIRVLVNEAALLGDRAWLVGIDSQRGHLRAGEGGARDDLGRAYAAVPPGAPSVLMAHEPDVFARGDSRPVLQVSGHTHGGQGQLFGWRPMTPSAHGSRYAWGHMEEEGRHLVVSGGVGFSGVPLRVAQPPELTVVRLRRGPGRSRA
jgi:predicted MPP superfamily phosphohydrolase